MEDYKQVLIGLMEFITDRVGDNGKEAIDIREGMMDVETVSHGELMAKKEIIKKLTAENDAFNEVVQFIAERVEL